MAELEKDMEDKLIKQLVTGESQWTYRPDITNEDELWNNFRNKLNANNLAVLNGVELTDQEFDRVKRVVLDYASTPYDAAVWFAGENGICHITIPREDASKGDITLFIMNNRDIAGGRSSYEVIDQYVTNKNGEKDRQRRFDITLLINGLPLIHIELKNRMHPFMDAFRQIQKYAKQGKFRGIFGLVQMYVVSNGSNTKYIAADVASKLNEQFLTSWVDKDNKPVEDYLEFTKAALSIPAAHLMVGQYAVTDNAKKKVILLRSYQINAVNALVDAAYQRFGGYIWHTTGSGKTLTSYTVTKKLLHIPSVDKAIFLIDRKDLDTQTSDDFKAYAENDSIDVDDTDNTGQLLNKLCNKDRVAIVTTIQKLQRIIKRYKTEEMKDNPKTKRLKSLNLCFVVDECHRTVSPETKRIIEQFFTNSLWYGFTGTPIFEENKRAQKGDLPRTTEALYGKCLHNYTVREALNNKAVLGFQIEYLKGIEDEELRRICVECGESEERIASLERLELEKLAYTSFKSATGNDLYGGEEHKKQVVEFICNDTVAKLHLNAPEGKAYEGILTVPSIKDAQEYYKLFKSFIASGGVSEKVKKLLPDFPKIAITYTVGENADGAMANQEMMQESLDDYNAMFKTKLTMEDNMAAYNYDLNHRLQRKRDRYTNRSEQIDIVIVVDRLLTGFDAPCMSTLFIDRIPMAPQNIIQAFSRTNRLFDTTKRFGQVVICRTPAMHEEAIEAAFRLYSNGGGNDVTAPKYEEMKGKFRASLAALREMTPSPADIDDLPDDLQILRKFAKTFQRFDHAFGEIQVYLEWDSNELEPVYGITQEEIEEYVGKYQNVIERIKTLVGPTDPIDIDVEYELESVKITEINYRYLLSLMQAHVPEKGEPSELIVEDEKIDKFIDELGKANPKLAAVVGGVWNDLKYKPSDFIGRQVSDVIDDTVMSINKNKAEEFAAEWGIDPESVLRQAYDYNGKNKIEVIGDYEKYSQIHGENKLNKLKYKKQILLSVTKLIKEDMAPLIER